MHNPEEIHLNAVYRIPHDLKNSIWRELLFKKGDKLNLEVYRDVDYAGSIDDRKLTSSYCTIPPHHCSSIRRQLKSLSF